MERLRIAVPGLPEAKAHNYMDAMAHLGAEAVLVQTACGPEGFDGLLIPGGWDADPALYGEENVACRGVDPALDQLQLRILDAFVKAGKPVLGTCRGHQMINVYFGGSLIQHVPTPHIHTRDEDSTSDKAHLTQAEKGSFLEELYGERFSVNSAHHQAVKRLGEGLRIVQRSDDGIVEGIVHRDLPVWGVQWHPERMCYACARSDTVDGSALFEMFLNRCRGRD